MKQTTLIWPRNFEENKWRFPSAREVVILFHSKRSARRYMQKFEPKILLQRKKYLKFNLSLYDKAPQEIITKFITQQLIK